MKHSEAIEQHDAESRLGNFHQSCFGRCRKTKKRSHHAWRAPWSGTWKTWKRRQQNANGRKGLKVRAGTSTGSNIKPLKLSVLFFILMALSNLENSRERLDHWYTIPRRQYPRHDDTDATSVWWYSFIGYGVLPNRGRSLCRVWITWGAITWRSLYGSKTLEL